MSLSGRQVRMEAAPYDQHYQLLVTDSFLLGVLARFKSLNMSSSMIPQLVSQEAEERDHHVTRMVRHLLV